MERMSGASSSWMSSSSLNFKILSSFDPFSKKSISQRKRKQILLLRYALQVILRMHACLSGKYNNCMCTRLHHLHMDFGYDCFYFVLTKLRGILLIFRIMHSKLVSENDQREYHNILILRWWCETNILSTCLFWGNSLNLLTPSFC